MKTWFSIKTNEADDMPAEVLIYDDIGAWGVTAKDFTEKLGSIKSKKINLRINSGGGDFFDGCAIYNAIKEHPAETTCHVTALAASAASIIAIAGKKVTVAKNGFLMIHNVMSMAFGSAADMRKEAELLDRLSGSAAAMYAAKTGHPAADMQKLMDDETWFDAAEAKKLGLVDEIKDDDEEDDDETPLNSATAMRAVAKYKKAPDRLRKFAASLTAKTPEQEQIPMAQKITVRDGKHFVSIDGKEIEIEAPVAAVQPKPEPAVDLDAIRKQATDKAVTEERAYRSMFTTVVASAKLTGADAEKFEKDFYGRAEADLKFLATHAIGTRATPVGEGSGEQEKKTETDADKSAKVISDYCANRFKNDASMRRRFKVNTTNAADQAYKDGLARYIAVETKCRADEAAPKNQSKEDGDEQAVDDPISRVMRNRTVYSA